MKGQLKVQSPREYIEALPAERQKQIAALHHLIRQTVPKLAPHICAGMLGYGPVHYRYPSGREGDTARITVASNAASISLYLFAADARGWVAERYRSKLPKAKIGKSCVRFKKLDDLDLGALRALLREAEAIGHPDVPK